MSRLTSDDVVLDLSMASVPQTFVHTSIDGNNNTTNNNYQRENLTSNQSKSTLVPQATDITLLDQHTNTMLPSYQVVPEIAPVKAADDAGDDKAENETKESEETKETKETKETDEDGNAVNKGEQENKDDKEVEASAKEDEEETEDENKESPLDEDNSVKVETINPFMLHTASLDTFTASGFYTAFWSVTAPLEKRMETTINIKNNIGGRIEVGGSWKRVENSDPNDTTPETTRFRLDKKLWVQEGYRVEAELRVSFKKEGKPNSTTNSGTVSLFELQPFNSETNSNPVITFEYQMDFPISLIPPCLQGDTKAAVIDATISKDEKSMVTLSRAATDWVLDIWDLETIATTTTPRLPVASVRYPEVDKDDSEGSTFIAEISSNGQYVVVFEYPGYDRWKMEEGFQNKQYPVRVFQRASSMYTNKKQKAQSNEKEKWTAAQDFEVEALVELRYDPKSPLSDFAGSIKFAHRIPGNIQPTANQEYVLVACDGIHVDVYDIRSGFKLLSTFSLAPHFESEQSAIHALRFTNNLQDTLSIWHTAWSGETTVWNWRTGQCVGYFPGCYDTGLSRDESILFVQFWPFISFYSVATGAQLGVLDMSMEDRETNIDTPFDSSDPLSVLQWDRVTGQGAAYDVNVLSAEVIEKRKFRLPFSPLPIRCLTLSSTAGSMKTVMCKSEQSIEFMAIPMDEDNTLVPRHDDCGPKCTKISKKAEEELKVFYDKELYCTFKCIDNTIQKTFHVVRITDGPDSTCQTLIELGEEENNPKRSWAFYPSQRRLLIWRSWNAELWELPNSLFSTECKLLAVTGWSTNEGLCKHGNLLQTDLNDTSMVFDTTLSTFLKPDNTFRLMQRAEQFAKEWKNFSAKYRLAIIRLIEAHINNDPHFEPEGSYECRVLGRSVMWAVAASAAETRDDSFLRAVLGSNHRRYWTPSENEFSADPEKDMIAFLISIFKLPVAWILIEYCLARAHDTDPKFLDILAISMPHLLEKHSDVAREIARRASFVKVKDQRFTCQLSVINDIQWRWKFWKPAKRHLYEIIDESPVFHRLYQLPSVNSNERSKTSALVSNEIPAVEKNGNIRSHLFVVPFSLVWTVHSKGMNTPSTKQTGLATSSTSTVFKILRTLWHFVYPFDTVFVHTHFSDPEVFDNPAIVALMTYKWTRFARYFWMIRMMAQTGYELLVLAVTFVQIYGDVDRRSNLSGGYIAIIVLGYLLLHLEFQQMRAGVGQYFSSPYNYVDLSVYIIPLAASASLLVESERTDSLRAMSFAIILIYLHFIFELRVYKNVCKVVTIVVNILMQIPAFFVILAIFILAFAHSINHLTEVNFRSDPCLPNDDGSIPTCRTLRDEFPTPYLQTVSATYFFMTGDYGPVGTSLTDGHWTSQLMIGLFFFLTAVLMMNVVIALMNGAYSDAVILAEQTWLKNRLELVASAENLSYFLPNFRDRFDFFPKHVYYTATDKMMTDYREKYKLEPLQFSFPEIDTFAETDEQSLPSFSSAEVAVVTAPTAPAKKAEATVATKEDLVTLPGVQGIVKTELQTSLLELQEKMNLENRMYMDEMEAKMIKVCQEMEERLTREKQQTEQNMADMLESLKVTLLAQQNGTKAKVE